MGHLRVPRHVLENLGDDVVGSDALGLGLEIQDEAMAQGGGRDRLDVIEADVESALDQGADLAGEDAAFVRRGDCCRSADTGWK